MEIASAALAIAILVAIDAWPSPVSNMAVASCGIMQRQP